MLKTLQFVRLLIPIMPLCVIGCTVDLTAYRGGELLQLRVKADRQKTDQQINDHRQERNTAAHLGESNDGGELE